MARPIFEIAQAYQRKLAEDLNYANEFETNFRNNFLASYKVPEEMAVSRANAQQARYDYTSLNQNFGTNLGIDRNTAQFNLQDSQRTLDQFGRQTTIQDQNLASTIADNNFAESQRGVIQADTALGNKNALRVTQNTASQLTKTFIQGDLQLSKDIRDLEYQRDRAATIQEKNLAQDRIDLLYTQAEEKRVGKKVALENIGLDTQLTEAQGIYDRLPTTEKTAANRVDLDLIKSKGELDRSNKSESLLNQDLDLSLEKLKLAQKNLPLDDVSQQLVRTVNDLANQRTIDANGQLTEEDKVNREVSIENAKKTLRLMPDGEARDALVQTLAIMETKSDIALQPAKSINAGKSLSVESRTLDGLIARGGEENRIAGLTQAKAALDAEESLSTAQSGYDEVRAQRALNIETIGQQLAQAKATGADNLEIATLTSSLNKMAKNQEIDNFAQEAENKQKQLQVDSNDLALALQSAPSRAEAQVYIDAFTKKQAQDNLTLQGPEFAAKQKAQELAIAALDSQIASSGDVNKAAELTAKRNALQAQHDIEQDPKRYAKEIADAAFQETIRVSKEKLDKLTIENNVAVQESSVEKLRNDAQFNKILASGNCQLGDSICETQTLIMGSKALGNSMSSQVALKVKQAVMDAASGEIDIMKKYVDLISMPDGPIGSIANSKKKSAAAGFKFMAQGQTFQILQDAVKNGILDINELPQITLDILANPEEMQRFNDSVGTELTPEQTSAMNSPTGSVVDTNAPPPVFPPSANFAPKARAIESRLPPEYKGLFSDDNVDANNVGEKLNMLATLLENVDSLPLQPSEKAKMKQFINERAIEFSDYAQTTIKE